MKIVSLISNGDYTPVQIDALEKYGEFIQYKERKLTDDQIVEKICYADYIILGAPALSNDFGENIMSRCKNLKLISAFASGVDYIDLEAANKYGIKVSNLKGANSQSVAEHAWALLLNLSKRVAESHNGAKEGRYFFRNYLGTELHKKTIGIIGFGEIGQKVARIAKGFDMNVMFYNRSEKVVEGARQVILDELLANSDFIAVTIAETVDTINFLSKEQFDQMKNGAIVVSIAREPVIDKEAALEAVESGKLMGLGIELDITNKPDERYFEFPNIIITPHTAFFTAESEDRTTQLVVDNILRFIEGKPQNIIN